MLLPEKMNIMPALLRRIFAVVAMVLVAFPFGSYAVDTGDIAPAWTLESPHGKSIEFYQHVQGNPSVLLFWATWCPYCRTLMPHLQELANQYQPRGVRFYALNIFEDGEPEKYISDNDYTFTLLLTADLVAEEYAVNGTPAVFLVDHEKKVIFKRASGMADEDVKQKIDNLLKTWINDHQ